MSVLLSLSQCNATPFSHVLVSRQGVLPAEVLGEDTTAHAGRHRSGSPRRKSHPHHQRVYFSDFIALESLD